MSFDFSYSNSEEESYDLQYSDPVFSDPISEPDVLSLLNDEEPIQDYIPAQSAADDPNIAISTSIAQSKKFIEDNLGVSMRDLRVTHIPGLVILRLEDFALIRDVSKLHRAVPHLIIGPPNEEFLYQHPDFAKCFGAIVRPQ